MSKFVFNKRLNLDSFGEDWKDCYIILQEPSVEEIKALAVAEVEEKSPDKEVDNLLRIIKGKFVEGKVYNGKEVVALKKEDLGDLPFSVYRSCINFLMQPGQTSTDTK